jgi:predicted phosphodiesterase
MRLAIISDIHANLEALQATLRSIETDRVDRIVCLGDIVGYNANPLECVNEIRNCAALCVAGNHDRAVCGQISTEGFPRAAARALAWTRSRLDDEALDFLSALPLTRCIEAHLVAVHGALHPHVGQELVRLDTDERRWASFDALRRHPSAAPLCAFGHTHRLGIYEYRAGVVHMHETEEVMLQDGSVYLINPGSVGQSRTSERRATYLLLDASRRRILVRRIDYDARAAIAKARAAGLLPRSHLLMTSARKVAKWGTLAIGLADAQRH